MFEKEIKIKLIKKGLKPSDVYKALGLQRAHFYQAIRSSNLKNKTLLKILDYLELEIKISLVPKVKDEKV
jgi:DNA-binding phage protein